MKVFLCKISNSIESFMLSVSPLKGGVLRARLNNETDEAMIRLKSSAARTRSHGVLAEWLR